MHLPAKFSKSLGAAVAALLISALTSAHGQVSNGGFESGALAPWNSIGISSVGGTVSSQGPAEGNFQAIMSTSGGGTVQQGPLESFLGLTAGTLNSLNGAGTFSRGGSAIAQTFNVPEGGVIQFAWDFLPNGSNGAATQNDTVFYTLHLASVSSSSFTILSRTSDRPTGTATGYQTFLTGPLTAGNYLLGFAAYDVSSPQNSPANAQDPTLLIDNVLIVPEPSTWALLVLGSVIAGRALQRRRRA